MSWNGEGLKESGVPNASSDYEIQLSGWDESDEDSLSGYCPGRDLNWISLDYRVKCITVDLIYSLEYWKSMNEAKYIPCSWSPRSERM
jgi:hypothetical protein